MGHLPPTQTKIKIITTVIIIIHLSYHPLNNNWSIHPIDKIYKTETFHINNYMKKENS